MSARTFHDFGLVEPSGDAFEFYYGTGPGAECRLVAILQTERGPQRRELAAIPAALWRKVSVRAVRELAAGMGETERTKSVPQLKTGINRLRPLLGRELAVLLWALMEEGAEAHLEAILHGWRELAREERWWLFAKASSPRQSGGRGWRRALFHALSEPGDTRSAEPDLAEKKSPPNTFRDCSPRQPGMREGTVHRLQPKSTAKRATSAQAAKIRKMRTAEASN